MRVVLLWRLCLDYRYMEGATMAAFPPWGLSWLLDFAHLSRSEVVRGHSHSLVKYFLALALLQAQDLFLCEA